MRFRMWKPVKGGRDLDIKCQEIRKEDLRYFKTEEDALSYGRTQGGYRCR